VHLARILDAVRAHVPRVAERDGTFFEAAVALILRETVHNEIELLFIKRAEREGDPWSGQVALPGGRRDPSDGTLVDTAVRETREEVGLDLLRDGAIAGALDELRPRTIVLPPVIVRPFVATLSRDVPIIVSDEVDRYFWAPLNIILAVSSARETEIVVRGERSMRPAIHFGEHVVWGMTERILRDFEGIIR
jgi:8-oxo-dGTP pyrophosphatase MutT (NUDIX family)